VVSGLIGAFFGALAFIVVFHSPAPFVGLKSAVGYGWITTIPALGAGAAVFGWSTAKLYEKFSSKL
jgi:hypothetical protein